MEDLSVDGGTWHRTADGLDPAELSALLSGAPFLQGLAPEVVADVTAACELVQLEGDQRLLRWDTPNDSLYLVVHGGLRTFARDERGRERVMFESYRGDGVGLVGLLSGVSSPVNVFAIRDSLLLRLTRARFEALGAVHPELVVRLAQAIARRGLALLERQPAWTAWVRPGAGAQNIALLVPDTDPSFARAAADLASAALERYHGVERITRSSLDQALGAGASLTPPGGVGNERVLSFLQGLELKSDIVLYQSDSTVIPWSERCVRQADRVLVILRADRADHREDIRALLERTLSRQQVPRLDVALVHPEHADVPRSDVAGWTWLPPRARVHHLRMGNFRDYERLARTLVRSGVAVVLSGGGARGIAHLGVLKAMEDAHVPVDAIAGTSMGAIIAAGYARGWDAMTILGRVRELFRRRMALYDPTLPFEALLAGRKLERVLRSYFESIDILNLWLPFFCVSTDLPRAETHVHDRGDLWLAVAASCSIPGIFPPRRVGNDHLVDGGIMDNLPIDEMAARFEGAIVASDVMPDSAGAPSRPERGGPMRRFLRGLTRRGSTPTGPGIFETLARSTTVGGRHATLTALSRGAASLHLSLPVGRFRLLDWDAHDDLFAAGYEYASEQLASWKPPWGHDAAREAGR